MSVSPSWTLSRTLSRRAFEDLCSLWQKLLVKVGTQGRMLTEKSQQQDVSPEDTPSSRTLFRLLLCSEKRFLLMGEARVGSVGYQVMITCDPEVIFPFLTQYQLSSLLVDVPEPLINEENGFAIAEPSTSDLHSYLLSEVIEIVARDITVSAIPYSPGSEGLTAASSAESSKSDEEQLFEQIIVKIRKNSDLSSILEPTIQGVCDLLQVDRVVIYQLQVFQTTSRKGETTTKQSGKVTYEARRAEAVPSLLDFAPEDDCFTQVAHYLSKYQSGDVVGVDDVESTYSSSFCLIELLKANWIRSKLISPLLIEGKLWGLMIAHQCFKKRQWLPKEKLFLGKIADYLAIAIFQAQLYAQVQQQKNSFEQRVIEQTQELRETLIAANAASQSKNAFLGNMSHELRTPLTCIIGLSGTLLHWSDKSQTLPLAKQQQYLQIIQDSGKHLLEMINDILEYSQLEAGKVVLNIQEVSLHQLALRIIKGFEEEARRKHIRLSLDFQVGEAADLFWVDSERLNQILLHLIHNSLKFTPEGGTVILRIWREQNLAVFQFEDTGIGISDHQLPLLFEQFQQLEKSLQRTYGGTGLGLALTKQLVELHGGIIEVESTVGQGSIFTVRLPNQFHKNFPKSTLPIHDAFAESASRSVVLLMQEEDVATMMCELLTAANYQVIWLTDNTPSLRRLELLKPILLVMDRELSITYSLSQRIKKSPVLRSLKILLVSQQFSAEDWENFERNGIDDYLLKPIQPNLLLQRINSLLASGLLATPAE